MKYDSQKMREKAQFIVPQIRDNYKQIIIIATLQQFLSLIAAFILFYYTFYFATYLIFPAVILFLYFLYISINKSTIKEINKEIRRQTKCKQHRKK
jgi:Sec-independent protein secretion pathway component TatC